MSKSKNSSGKLTIIAVGLAFLASLLVGTLLLVQGYNHRISTADSEEYISTEEFIFFLTQAEEICKKATDQGAKEHCKDTYDSLMNHAALHDLLAQETVAKATRMLMWASIAQAIAALFTVSFLIWTVGQAYGILDEARKTTKATKAALKISKVASIIEYQPYFSFTRIKERLGNFDNIPIAANEIKANFEFDIKNIGRSIASDVSEVTIESAQILLQQKLTVNSAKPLWVSFILDKAVDVTNDDSGFLISPEEKATLSFRVKLLNTKSKFDISRHQNNLEEIKKYWHFTYFFRGHFTYVDNVSRTAKKHSIRKCTFVINHMLNQAGSKVPHVFAEISGRVINYETIPTPKIDNQ